MRSCFTVSRKPLWILLLSYLLFVIYGSLVPLNFTPRPLAQALADFQASFFSQLSIGSRADWVTNLLLFIPLGFFTARLATIGARLPSQLLRCSGIVLGCMALAVTLEFTQLFFHRE